MKKQYSFPFLTMASAILLTIGLPVFCISAASLPPQTVFSETWEGVSPDPFLIDAGSYNAGALLTPENPGTDNTWLAITQNSSTVRWRFTAQTGLKPTSTMVLRHSNTNSSTWDASFRSLLPVPLSEDNWTSFTLSFIVRYNNTAGTADSRVYLYLASDGGEATGTDGVATIPTNGYGFYQNHPAAAHNTHGGLVVTNADGSTSATIGTRPAEGPYGWSVTFFKDGSQTRVQYRVTSTTSHTPFLSGETTIARTVAPGTVFDRVVIRAVDYPRSRLNIDDITIVGIPNAGVIEVSPETIELGAPPDGASQRTAVIRNVGTHDLHIASIAMGPQGRPGAFSIVSGGTDVPVTLTPGATRDLTIQFNESSATPSDQTLPTTGTLLIQSDSAGLPTETAVSLAGWRSDHFVWDGADGAWTSAIGWTPDGVPVAEDTAEVASGTVTRGTVLNIGSHIPSGERATGVAGLTLSGGGLNMDAPAGHLLFIAPHTGDNAQVTQTGGTLSFNRGLRVGQAGIGSYTMHGGIINGIQSINIANEATAIGTMTVTAGTITLPNAGASQGNTFVIGERGTASYTQSGGSFLSGRFLVGSVAGSQGTANLTGGIMTFNATTTQNCGVGSNGTGVFTVDGGTLNVDITNAAWPFRLGLGETGDGTLILKSGAVNVPTVDFVVGDAGVGVFEMEGGTAAMTKVLIAKAATGSGAVSMSGGTLTADSLEKGAGSITGLSWTGGTVSVGTVNLAGTALANNGGTLAPGGTGVGTTTFVNTHYTQSAGGVLEIELDGASGDRLEMNNGAAATIAGTILITYTGATPASGSRWDIITTANGGTANISAADIVFPDPPANWSVIAAADKITVRYGPAGPAIAHDAGAGIAFTPVYRDLGESSKDAVFKIQSVGTMNLTVSALIAAPGRFSVVSPAVPFDVAPDAEQEVVLRFTETELGDYTGVLTIQSNDSNAPEITIDLSGSVVGTPPPPAGSKGWMLY